jgi:hypothetical protein
MRLLISICFVIFSQSVFAQYQCTASSQGVSSIKDGLLFSKEVDLKGKQGVHAGHVLLHEQGDLSFYLVAGATMTINNKSILLSFYTEIRNTKSNVTTRAMSGIVDDIKQARLELVTYPNDSYLYEAMIDFQCQSF